MSKLPDLPKEILQSKEYRNFLSLHDQEKYDYLLTEHQKSEKLKELFLSESRALKETQDKIKELTKELTKVHKELRDFKELYFLEKSRTEIKWENQDFQSFRKNWLLNPNRVILWSDTPSDLSLEPGFIGISIDQTQDHNEIFIHSMYVNKKNYKKERIMSLNNLRLLYNLSKEKNLPIRFSYASKDSYFLDNHSNIVNGNFKLREIDLDSLDKYLKKLEARFLSHKEDQDKG